MSNAPTGEDGAKEQVRYHTRQGAAISRAFAAGADDVDAVVRDALGRMGADMDVDVVFVAVFGEETITDVWEWTSWGGAGRPPSVGDRIDEVYASIIEALHQGVAIRIADIPALGMAESDAEVFSAIDARSVLMVPVRRGDELAGAASILAVGRTIDWTDEHVATLQFYGDLLVSAVARRRARTAGRYERARAARIAEHLADALVFVDRAGRVTWAAPSVARTLGHEPDALQGRPVEELAIADHRDALRQGLAVAWNGTTSAVTVLLRRADGAERWCEVSPAQVVDPDAEPELLLTIRDVHARQLEVAELADLAVTDSLTGVLNRRGLRQAIDGLGAADLPATVLFVDLDRFKLVNDRHGHAIGDEVLTEMGHRLRRAAGARGLVARLGGDEFVVVQPGVSMQAAAAVLQAVRAELGRPVATGAGALEVGATVGTGTMLTLDDPARAIAEADAAMYRAKLDRR